MAIWKTRYRRWAQVIDRDGMYAGFARAKIGHGGVAFGRYALIWLTVTLLALLPPLPRPDGVMAARFLLLGANTSWKRVRLTLDLGTKGASLAIKSSGLIL